MKFTFGSDPEFMVVHGDELSSAIGRLPKKETPKVVEGHRFYYDNVLAEVGVKPGKTRQEVIDNIQQSLQLLSGFLAPARFELRAAANYPAKELKCDQAKIAGCVPEWDVYTLQVNEPPENIVEPKDGYYQFKVPFRTAGGHIHIGAEWLEDPQEVFNVIRMMDLFIGVPSIFLDTDSTSKDRRKAYGLAGSHRIPEYGLEYRPLGNFWFASPEHVGLIYDLASFVLTFVENNGHEKFWSVNEDLLDDDDPSLAYSCFGYDLKSLKKAINSCDKKLAEKFMVVVSNYLPDYLVEEIERLAGKPLPDPYKTWEIK